MPQLRAIDRHIRLLAERQHGLVARRQLLALGLGAEAIVHRRRTGRLVAVDRGVYALGHRPSSVHTRWMQIVLVMGPRVVLSHRSAAALWGLRPGGASRVDVTCPSHAGRQARAGVVVHRTRTLAPTEVTASEAIPVTSVARTLVDLAAVVRPHEVRRAVERADEAELFDLRDVRRILDVLRGRPGVATLEAVLADAADHGLAHTRSDLEALFLQLCLDRDIPRPVVNGRDGAGEVDFRWPDRRVAVELDGYRWHRSRRAFEADRARSQVLAARGWTLLRVSDRQLVRTPATVALRVTAALRAARA
ncbi:DUF559 domain-containing protein [Baekduia soli]|uniref:DUF559 domain-containing protein n=1 Tax=Baekduia soli TaxID=496014 RepID=A0A5B8TZW6_9ACTN|nr:type IV toxin-antitoxin system AbiEi family antitoxin domain-containing protein [Baekduia soli]QEC46266.1 DUF559 domain-containing protein [Baekduia soli]